MSRRRRPKHPAFKKGQAGMFGISKHRQARIKRFASKNPKSSKIPCRGCGRHQSRCNCPKEA